MAFSPVQTLNGGETGTASASLTASFASNVVGGNRVFVYSAHYSANGVRPPNTPTSTPSLTWTKLVEEVLTSGSDRFYTTIWTAVMATTGTLQVSMANTAQAGDELGWTAEEYSGLDSSAGAGCLDVSAASGVASASATTACPTGTSGAETAANQLVLAAYGDWGAGLTITAPSGFTKVTGASRDAATSAGQCVGRKTGTNGATEGGNFTYASTAVAAGAVVAAIKLAAGAAAGAVPPDSPTLPITAPFGTDLYRRQRWAYLNRFRLMSPASTTASLSRTATDSVSAISDSASAIRSFLRSASDAIAAISDLAARLLSLARSAADASAVSEAATRLLSLAAPASDALGAITDAAVRAATARIRSATDAPILSDAPSRTSDHPRIASDSEAAISDAAVGQKGVLRIAADSVAAISESATRAALNFVRSASDATSLSDAVARLLIFARTAADSMAISEAVAAGRVVVRTASDSVTAISESASRTLALARTAAQSVTSITDVAVRAALSFIRTGADAPVISDLVVAGKGIVRTAADSLTAISESAVGTSARLFVRTATDSVAAISDSAVRQALHFARTAADAAVISDAVVIIRHFIRSAGDVLAVVVEVASRGGLGPFRRLLEANLPRSVLGTFLRSSQVSSSSDINLDTFQPRSNVDSTAPDDDLDTTIQGG